MLTISIGNDVLSNLAQVTGTTNDALWPLIVIVIAIPLTFYLMRRLIALLKSTRRAAR